MTLSLQASRTIRLAKSLPEDWRKTMESSQPGQLRITRPLNSLWVVWLPGGDSVTLDLSASMQLEHPQLRLRLAEKLWTTFSPDLMTDRELRSLTSLEVLEQLLALRPSR